MLPPHVKQQIDSLWSNIIYLEQPENSNNSSKELHADYKKLISLTLQYPACLNDYLEAVINDAWLYLEEKDYRHAREMFLQIKNKTIEPTKENVDFLINAWVNVAVTYDLQSEQEDFSKAVEEALLFINSLVKHDKGYFYSSVKGRLYLARILYDRGIYQQAFEYSDESFLNIIPIGEGTMYEYFDFANEWLPIYKSHDKFIGMEIICRGLVELSKLPDNGYSYFPVVCTLNELACEYVKETKEKEACILFDFIQQIYKNNKKIKASVFAMADIDSNKIEKNYRIILQKGDKVYRKLLKEKSSEEARKKPWWKRIF